MLLLFNTDVIVGRVAKPLGIDWATESYTFEEGDEELGHLTGFVPSPNRIVHLTPGASQTFQDLVPLNAEKSVHGTGGVYFLRDSSMERRAVFKPADEENSSSEGNGFIHEYAAYLLDKGMAGVPETMISVMSLDAEHLQIGSLQAYIEDSEDAEDFGPGLFQVDDVHRIGVLDVRILNCDRHSGNLMRNTRTGKLLPIDHGASFPCAMSGKLSEVSFEWLQYPQAKEPFSSELLKEIEAIDVIDDIEMLEDAGVSRGGQLATWMSTTLLKLAAKEGKSLYEIGRLVQRHGDRSQPSVLEELFQKASVATDHFFQVFTELAKLRIKEL